MSLETDVKILARVPMLSEFSEDKLRLLAFSAESRSWRAGQRIYAAGDRADAGLVIASGEVALADPSRPEAAPEIVGPSTLIGEMAMIVDGQRATTATAVGDVTAILIRRPLFRRMLEEYPDVAGRMHQRLSARLAETTRALTSVRRRLDDIDH